MNSYSEHHELLCNGNSHELSADVTLLLALKVNILKMVRKVKLCGLFGNDGRGWLVFCFFYIYISEDTETSRGKLLEWNCKRTKGYKMK